MQSQLLPVGVVTDGTEYLENSILVHEEDSMGSWERAIKALEFDPV
jgi:hypothetical protein